MSDSATTRLPIVILLSGNGSNLQAIIDAAQNGQLPVDIRAVISNRYDAYGLTRAAQANIPGQVVPNKQFPSREAYDQALMKVIDAYEPALVILAGFMRILTPDFVDHYHNRMLNIHPSLLPKYRGLNTHQRAIDAGDKQHGASVHLVTPELDAGPVLAQAMVPVHEDDNAETLAQRVHAAEHQLYPTVIEWFARGRIHINKDKVFLDKTALDAPVVLQF